MQLIAIFVCVPTAGWQNFLKQVFNVHILSNSTELWYTSNFFGFQVWVVNGEIFTFNLHVAYLMMHLVQVYTYISQEKNCKNSPILTNTEGEGENPHNWFSTLCEMVGLRVAYMDIQSITEKVSLIDVWSNCLREMKVTHFYKINMFNLINCLLQEIKLILHANNSVQIKCNPSIN